MSKHFGSVGLQSGTHRLPNALLSSRHIAAQLQGTHRFSYTENIQAWDAEAHESHDLWREVGEHDVCRAPRPFHPTRYYGQPQHGHLGSAGPEGDLGALSNIAGCLRVGSMTLKFSVTPCKSPIGYVASLASMK
jgi:hypothetical protein